VWPDTMHSMQYTSELRPTLQPKPYTPTHVATFKAVKQLLSMHTDSAVHRDVSHCQKEKWPYR